MTTEYLFPEGEKKVQLAEGDSAILPYINKSYIINSRSSGQGAILIESFIGVNGSRETVTEIRPGETIALGPDNRILVRGT